MADPKLCDCGCGEVAPIARKTRALLGHVKGQPTAFVNGGHARRGKGKPPLSTEGRARIAATRRGRALSGEHRAEISSALRGERNPAWRGGRHVDFGGYVRVSASPGRRLHEHRLVMAERIGRDLLPGETVHHVNEDKTDNRPSNLWLFPDHTAHMEWHAATAASRLIRRAMAAITVG